MSQDLPWIAGMLQMSDTFYPTGSYAHSFGLEGLVQSGAVHDLQTLRTFLLEEALPTLARTDLAVCALAWHALSNSTKPAPGDEAWAEIGRLCELGSALRGARELRAASEAIGKQRCSLAARLQGETSLAAEFERRAEANHWSRPACVAAAVEARTLNAPLDAALAALIYANAAALLAASVKLLRLGQNSIQTLLAECLQRAPALIAEARALPPDEIGAFTPWWDVASARHERADFRLFIS